MEPDPASAQPIMDREGLTRVWHARWVDPDYTATIGLNRDQARALVAAADADRGPQALRTVALPHMSQ